MRMELGDLIPFLAVARTGSFGGAAKQLGVATTTVARRIDALERDLGLRLIDRRADGAKLTAHGERICSMLPELEARASEIERLATTLRGDGPPRVRVSATESVIADF